MSKQGVFKCYQLIIDKISRRPGIRFFDLAEYLFDEGFEISTRTLQRYIEQIRNEFSIEISYNAADRGYYIKNVEGPDTELFLQLLAINDTAGALIDSIKSGNTLRQYVQMENAGISAGADHIKTLLEAAKKQKVVTIHHQRFDSDKPKEHRIEPYLLKEFQGRWYVWAKLEGKKEFRTFGLDRIKKADVTSKKFTRDARVDANAVFGDMIGVFASGEKPTEVILSFSKKIAQYIKGLPIHHSQKLIRENDDTAVFSIFLAVNFELIKTLLAYGPDVKVLAPSSLAKEIASLHKSAYKQYSR